jgi:hypothetical protein
LGNPAETFPYYLILTSAHVPDGGTSFKACPAIGEPAMAGLGKAITEALGVHVVAPVAAGVHLAGPLPKRLSL